MTYPMPISVPTGEFLAVAQSERLILIRNDLDFENMKKSGNLSGYILSRDNWHPSEKGYTVVSNNVFDAIVRNEWFLKGSGN